MCIKSHPCADAFFAQNFISSFMVIVFVTINVIGFGFSQGLHRTTHASLMHLVNLSFRIFLFEIDYPCVNAFLTRVHY